MSKQSTKSYDKLMNQPLKLLSKKQKKKKFSAILMNLDTGIINKGTRHAIFIMLINTRV